MHVRTLLALLMMSTIASAQFRATPSRPSETQDQIRCFGYVREAATNLTKHGGTPNKQIYTLGPNCFFPKDSEAGEIILRACPVGAYCQVEAWRTKPQGGIYPITQVVKVSTEVHDSKVNERKDLLFVVLQDEGGKTSAHDQQTTHDNCTWLLSEFRKAMRANTTVTLTFENNPFTGVILDAACILPDGSSQNLDGSISKAPSATKSKLR
jgi:hypothetical protein